MSNRKKPRRGVILCGAYGMDNAGDDAVLTAILAALRRLDGDMPLTVLTRSPKKTARTFHVRAVGRMRILRWLGAMRSSSLFISGGGTLLQDVTSRRSLLYYLLTIRLAKKCGCAVQLYGCGVGPLRAARSRARTARVLNDCADIITVRDGDSAACLQSIGVTRPRILLAADPALSLDAPSGEREARVGFILRPWPGFWAHVPDFARAARYAYETYRLAPVFLCLSPADRSAVRSVCAELADIPFTVSRDPRRVGRMSLVLSMRLHGLIFALRSGVPAAGVSYDPKVDAFCREAGLPCRALEGAAAGDLRRLMDDAYALDAEVLSAAAQRLLRRERANAAAAAQLLFGSDTFS